MKKQLLLLVLSLFLSSFSLNSAEANTSSDQTQQTKVVICTGGYAKRYHKTGSCPGLDACKGDKKTITLKEAQDKGRTPCKICY